MFRSPYGIILREYAYIESEVTKTSYLYRLSGSMRIQVMPMESGLCLSSPMDALVVSSI